MYGLDAIAIYSDINYSNNTYLLDSITIPSDMNVFYKNYILILYMH